MYRRSFCLALTAAVGAQPSLAQLSQIRERPDPRTFESGDFVWPKPAGTFIPYAGVPAGRSLTQADELTEEAWTSQRIDFIRAVRSSPPADPAERLYLEQLARDMENLSFTTFYNGYAADVSPSDFQTYGAGQLLYVGHVGIIDIDTGGEPFVIEAVYGKAPRGTSLVERLPYAEWLSTRRDPLVWHGRLSNVDPSRRADVARAASEQLNKPYRFFNFDLSDTSGFYCSKLVWYATMKATGIALDGNPNPKRPIWFSPLQAMKQAKAGRLDILSSAGNYRNA